MRWIAGFVLFLSTAIADAVGLPSESLKLQYDIHHLQASDINEHLPTLRQLAMQCSSVVEIGLRGLVSTWGILQGLSESQAPSRTYLGIDISYPPVNKLFNADSLAESNGIAFQFLQANDLNIDIDSTDMLFIDTHHTYKQLTAELDKHSPNVRKYIAMHDTSGPWGNNDEPDEYHINQSYPPHIDSMKHGLWPAVEDFLLRHPEWSLKERYFNNNGFTVLERKADPTSLF